MYYTTVSGWMLDYFYKFAVGTFDEIATEDVGGVFGAMLSDPIEMAIFMAITVLAGFGVLSFGVQKGLEKVNKVMMTGLLSACAPAASETDAEALRLRLREAGTQAGPAFPEGLDLVNVFAPVGKASPGQRGGAENDLLFHASTPRDRPVLRNCSSQLPTGQ